MANEGAGNQCGRFNTEPIVLPNSLILKGEGEVTLTGPHKLSFLTANDIALTTSMTCTHDTHCSPEPTVPPTNNLYGKVIRGRAPPSQPSTTPNLIKTVRTPYFSTCFALFSQSYTVLPRKSFDVSIDSSVYTVSNDTG